MTRVGDAKCIEIGDFYCARMKVGRKQDIPYHKRYAYNIYIYIYMYCIYASGTYGFVWINMNVCV